MDRQEKINKIVEAFLSKNYGETIEHFKLATLIEESVGSWEYRYIVKRAEKKLLDCGRMIENVRGAGYRVVNPDEYSSQSAKCVMSGARKINKGSKILLNAPVKDMSAEGVQAYNAITDRMKILQAAVSGARVEINMLSSKRENPLKQMTERTEPVQRSVW